MIAIEISITVQQLTFLSHPVRYLWIISSRNIYKCTDFMPIANISEVWIERTYTPSDIDVFLGGCTVKQAMYWCYHRLISWRATFGYCQMCWLLVIFLWLRREMLTDFDNIWSIVADKICNKGMHVYPLHLFTVLIPYLVKIMIHLPVFTWCFPLFQKTSPFLFLQLLGQMWTYFCNC